MKPKPPEGAWTVTVETSVTLTTGDVWPDGDWPEQPTAADVVIEMERYGSIRQLLRDWNLDDGLAVDVDGITVDLPT